MNPTPAPLDLNPIRERLDAVTRSGVTSIVLTGESTGGVRVRFTVEMRGAAAARVPDPFPAEAVATMLGHAPVDIANLLAEIERSSERPGKVVRARLARWEQPKRGPHAGMTILRGGRMVIGGYGPSAEPGLFVLPNVEGGPRSEALCRRWVERVARRDGWTVVPRRSNPTAA